MTYHDDHYALVVGIDDYPGYRSLAGAKADAEAFDEWLRDEDEGGRLPKSNVKLVLSHPDPIRPIHQDVDDALDEIFEAVGPGGTERLYVYFSGHGLARSNIGADLCLAEWRKRRHVALDSLDYLKLVAGSGRFRQIVMFLDCCRVRMVGNRGGLPCTLSFSRPDEDAAFSRSFVGYATEFQNAAYEAAHGLADDEEVRGHFTTALLDALRGAAAEPTGGVTASRLKDYLEVNTQDIAARSNHAQRPEVLNGLNGDAVFGHASPTAAMSTHLEITLTDARVGPVVLENPDVEEIWRSDATGGPWRIENLSRGLYMLRDLSNADERGVRVTGEEETLYERF